MTREEARILLRQHQDALNRHDVAGLTALYHEGAVVTSPMFNTVRGRAAIQETFQKLFTLWPDYQVRLQDALFICEGDRAAEFTNVTATHSAELFGLPPTGERIEYETVRLFTFRDGQIVDERRMYDLVGVLERLRNVRLERELTLAAEIQRTLLPRTRHVGPYFEVAGASVPSRAIGGDFFEYVHLPSGEFGAALGDVSGKGPAAALVAAMLQGIFSVYAVAGGSPSVTLARVNQAVRQRGIDPRYVTLVYGVLSPDGRFRYSNAGQNPPMLWTRRGVRRLLAGGPMLGLFDEVAFPEETVLLEPGDTLVAFSDGVTEALNAAGEEFTESRLLACLERHHDEAPQSLLDALMAQVRSFFGDAAQVDDLTMMVVRYR